MVLGREARGRLERRRGRDRDRSTGHPHRHPRLARVRGRRALGAGRARSGCRPAARPRRRAPSRPRRRIVIRDLPSVSAAATTGVARHRLAGLVATVESPTASSTAAAAVAPYRRSRRLELDLDRDARAASGSPAVGGVPARPARNGVRCRPTIFAGGHQSGSENAFGGSRPVSKRPRRTGVKGPRRNVRAGLGGDRRGGCVGLLRARPPCLTGNVVMSPAGTPSVAVTRPWRSTGDEPLERLRDTADPRPLEARGDHTVGRDDVAAGERALPRACAA